MLVAIVGIPMIAIITLWLNLSLGVSAASALAAVICRANEWYVFWIEVSLWD